MREFVIRMKVGAGAVDRGKIAGLLDEMAIWVGELPDEDAYMPLRGAGGEVIGFAQLQELGADIDYRLKETREKRS